MAAPTVTGAFRHQRDDVPLRPLDPDDLFDDPDADDPSDDEADADDDADTDDDAEFAGDDRDEDPDDVAALDEDFPLGDGVADTEAEVACPYCGEANAIALDPGGGAAQEYVEDCQVCCQPWRVHVVYLEDGSASVGVEPADGR
jgi:hypothetical protein